MQTGAMLRVHLIASSDFGALNLRKAVRNSKKHSSIDSKKVHFIESEVLQVVSRCEDIRYD